MAPDAAKYASTLNLLGAAGLDVQMAYLMGWDIVMSLYEAMTRSGKGGPIADAIIQYGNQAELEEWCINAIPEALGPLLRTLISAPEAFSINSSVSEKDQITERKRTYNQNEGHLLQQKAIERILGWIVKNAEKTNSIDKAQSQFESACMSMNKFGIKPENAEQSYCKNRSELDAFMAEGVLNLFDDTSNDVRKKYKTYAALLGSNLADFCQKNYTPRPNYSSSGAAPFLKNY
jgi:hypothetical protein